MLNGIRGRLLFTYVLLLTVTLMVTAVALILFLLSRPAVTPGDVHRDLLQFTADQLREYRMRDVLFSLQGNVNLSETDLATAATAQSVWILIVDPEDYTVIEDGWGTYSPGDALQVSDVRPLAPRDIERLDGGVRPPTPERLRDGLRPPRLQPDIALDRVKQGKFTHENTTWVFIQADLPDRLLFEGAPPAVIMAMQQTNTPLLAAIDQFRNSLGIALLQAGCAGVAVSTFLAIVVSRTLVGPLKILSQAALAVAEGDYDQTVPEKGPGEIQHVARAFNQMSDQVQLTNQAQRDLLASVSHDLRTPLTSIQGFSQAIMDGTAPDPAKAAAIIHDEADRLNRLVFQLMELSRLKTGQLAMRRDSLNITEMVGALVEKIEVVAQQKNIKISTKLLPTEPIVGDGDRLAQVITNLLSNAVKYTPEGGKIGVLVDHNPRYVRVAVKDTGVGIDANDLSRVFERFYQVDKSRGQSGGYGLGLAIVHEIVVAHGGEITVDSPGLNKGSTFTVTLPRSS